MADFAVLSMRNSYCCGHILDYMDLGFIWNGHYGVSATSSQLLVITSRLSLVESFLLLGKKLEIFLSHCPWSCPVLSQDSGMLAAGCVSVLLFLAWLLKFFLWAYVDTDLLLISWPTLFPWAFVNCYQLSGPMTEGVTPQGKAVSIESSHHWILLMQLLSNMGLIRG